MLFSEIVSVICECHMENVNTLCGKRYANFFLKLKVTRNTVM